jgi:hypothetical protein
VTCKKCQHVQPANSIKSKGKKKMFGDNNEAAIVKSDSGRGGDILKSGYDPLQVKGSSELRTQFAKTLDFDPKQAKEATLKSTARTHGQYKGMAEIARRVSQEKLGAGQAILDVYGIALDHANQAASLELQWQQRTQKGLEALSPKLLDMGVHQEQHAGFVEYCDLADKHLKF